MKELAREIGKELRVGLKGGMEVLEDEAFVRVVVEQSLCCVFGKKENEHIVEVLVNWFKANDWEIAEMERFQCSVVEPRHTVTMDLIVLMMSVASPCVIVTQHIPMMCPMQA